MNVKRVAPLLNVVDMSRSLRFYVDGLGFTIAQRWVDAGTLRWCRLERDGSDIMLQQFWTHGPHANVPTSPLGIGVTLCFFCHDAPAIYHEAIARGLAAGRPFVGNRMWVTTLADPDGYQILFESDTDVAEETEYDPALHGGAAAADSSR